MVLNIMCVNVDFVVLYSVYCGMIVEVWEIYFNMYCGFSIEVFVNVLIGIIFGLLDNVI